MQGHEARCPKGRSFADLVKYHERTCPQDSCCENETNGDTGRRRHLGARHAVERYRSARRLWRTYESGYLENAKVVLEVAETAYRVGGASLLEFLDAERTYAATQTDYVDTVFAVRVGLIALEKAVGRDLTRSEPRSTRPSG